MKRIDRAGAVIHPHFRLLMREPQPITIRWTRSRNCVEGTRIEIRNARPFRWAGLALALAAAAGMVAVSCEFGWNVETGPANANAANSCARCHVQIHAEWAGSRHATAAVGANYLAARKTLADGEGETCFRCHSPNLAALKTDDQKEKRKRIAEAVNCHACHVVREPHVKCKLDAAMGKGQSCRRCHELNGPLLAAAGREKFGIFTTFAEMALARGAGGNCLDCHMTAHSGRGEARSHRLDGAANARALRHAIDGRLDTFWADDELEIVLSLTNRGAGHHVPTGLPGRRLKVTVTAHDADGKTIDSRNWWLGRVLGGNAADDPVPFFRATREVSDNRLAAGQPRKLRLFVDRERVRRVVATIDYHPLDPAIAKALGRDADAVRVMELVKQLP